MNDVTCTFKISEIMMVSMNGYYAFKIIGIWALDHAVGLMFSFSDW